MFVGVFVGCFFDPSCQGKEGNLRIYLRFGLSLMLCSIWIVLWDLIGILVMDKIVCEWFGRLW